MGKDKKKKKSSRMEVYKVEVKKETHESLESPALRHQDPTSSSRRTRDQSESPQPDKVKTRKKSHTGSPGIESSSPVEDKSPPVFRKSKRRSYRKREESSSDEEVVKVTSKSGQQQNKPPERVSKRSKSKDTTRHQKHEDELTSKHGQGQKKSPERENTRTKSKDSVSYQKYEDEEVVEVKSKNYQRQKKSPERESKRRKSKDSVGHRKHEDEAVVELTSKSGELYRKSPERESKRRKSKDSASYRKSEDEEDVELTAETSRQQRKSTERVSTRKKSASYRKYEDDYVVELKSQSSRQQEKSPERASTRRKSKDSVSLGTHKESPPRKSPSPEDRGYKADGVDKRSKRNKRQNSEEAAETSHDANKAYKKLRSGQEETSPPSQKLTDSGAGNVKRKHSRWSASGSWSVLETDIKSEQDDMDRSRKDKPARKKKVSFTEVESGTQESSAPSDKTEAATEVVLKDSSTVVSELVTSQSEKDAGNQKSGVNGERSRDDISNGRRQGGHQQHPDVRPHYGKPVTFSDMQTSLSYVEEDSDSSVQLADCLFPLGEEAVALVLPADTCLTLAGKAFVRCLYGSLNIIGHTIQPSMKNFPVFSPNSTSHVTITSGQPEDCKDETQSDDFTTGLKELLTDITVTEDQSVDALAAAVKATDSVCLLQYMEDNMCDFVSSLRFHNNMFAMKGQSSNPRHAWFEDVPQIDCSLSIGSPQHSLRMSPPQQEFIQQFCQDVASGGSPAVAFCGGKNVGKSTMARHVINAALNSCAAVAYMECDVGQTEMTPPAFVSVHIVTEPLLGPPFTHQRKPLCMCYMGAVSPVNDPAYYMECVQHIYEKYSALECRPPLVVNTMGWNKGLGLSFLVDTLRLVNPSYVVQLNSSSLVHNMMPVDSDFMTSTLGIDAMRKYFKDDVPQENTTHHELIFIDSPVTSQRGDGRFRPADLRNMALLSHLNIIRDPQNTEDPLFGMTPVQLPWSHFAVHVMHDAVPNTQIMYALNGNLVALCWADPKLMDSSEDAKLPKFLKRIPVCHCQGLAIVRGIDPETKMFQLLSTVPESSFDQVNCMLLGSVELPQSLLMDQPELDGYVPYIDNHKDVIGATSIKPRRHMFRN